MKKEVVNYLSKESQLSIRQACKLTKTNRTTYYYKSHPRDDSQVIDKLETIANKHPSYGFKKMRYIIRNEAYPWNHKKIYRVYKLLNLNIQRKRKRRLPKREKQALSIPKGINEVWSMDFMSDALYNGRRFRTLNLIDDYNREVLWIDIAISIGAQHMVDILNWIIKERGKPRSIRVDNGPEFISSTFSNWCHKHRIAILYIQPGKPTQNAFIERFNRSYRTEILDAYVFNNLNQVRELTNEWIDGYNNIRPHESLGNLSPFNYTKNNNQLLNVNLNRRGIKLV
jgi:putative transposase